MRNFSKMKFKRRTTIGANPSIGLSFKTYNDRPQPRVRVMRCQSFKKVLNKIMKQLTSSFPNINLKGCTDSKICHQFEILSQVRAFYRKPNRRANLIAVWVQKSLGGEKEVCFKASCIISQESQRTRNSWPPVRTPTSSFTPKVCARTATTREAGKSPQTSVPTLIGRTTRMEFARTATSVLIIASGGPRRKRPTSCWRSNWRAKIASIFRLMQTSLFKKLLQSDQP